MLNPIQVLEQILEVVWSFIAPNPLPRLKIVPTGRAIRNLLTKRGTGFNLTGRLKLSPAYSYRGALVIGGTGTGKSRRTIIPTLLTAKGSFVVHDPSGELLNATYASLCQRGYWVDVFTPTDPDHSCQLNVLDKVGSIAEARQAANRIVATGYPDETGMGFWELSAVGFLTMCMSGLLKSNVGGLSLPLLYQLVNSWSAQPKGVESFFKSLDDDQVWAEYMNYSNYDEKLLSGIVATAKGALAYMTDENVQQATTSPDTSERSDETTSASEHRTISAKRLRSQPTAVFIQTKTTKTKDYQALVSLLFDYLFDELMEDLPQAEAQDVFLVIDEAGSLFIPSLPIAAANVRKYRVGILLALQDYAQLESLYGKDKASALRSNCFTQVIFGGGGLDQSQYYSRLLGLSDQPNGYGWRVPTVDVHELRELGSNQALLVCGNMRPYILNLPRIKSASTKPVKLDYPKRCLPPVLDLSIDHATD